MLGKLIKFIAGFFAVVLLVSGLRWLVDPSGAAEGLGMQLLDGVGRSTQIGDLAAFFIVAGGMALLGIVTANASLLVAPALLVALAAVFRTLAWVAHDAAFAPDMIAVEVVMCVFFLLARNRLAAGS